MREGGGRREKRGGMREEGGRDEGRRRKERDIGNTHAIYKSYSLSGWRRKCFINLENRQQISQYLYCYITTVQYLYTINCNTKYIVLHII